MLFLDICIIVIDSLEIYEKHLEPSGIALKAARRFN